jgi:hypothetical protein
LVSEAQRFFENNDVTDVRLGAAQTGGKFGASSERFEVEACIKIAAHRAGAAVWCLSKEKVRVAYGLPKGEGAFEALLERPDVRNRSNKDRRFQYLMAKAPSE